MKKNLLIFTAILLVSNLYAKPLEKSYIGLGIGMSAFIDGGYSRDVEASIAPYTLKTNYNGIGMKLYGGYHFNEVLALEASYTNYGTYEMTSNTTNTTHKKLNPSSYSAAVNLGFNYGDNFQNRIFSLMGLSLLQFGENGETRYNENKLSTALRLGLGYEYSPIRSIGLRVAYEGDFFLSNNLDSSLTSVQNSYTQNMNLFYLGISYKF